MPTRSQAESYVRLGYVRVNNRTVQKPGQLVGALDEIKLTSKERYVSRAGLKLASVAKLLNLDFRNTSVLDIGSSTGGFTDYALQHGADYVIAVDVGTQQLHPTLLGNPQIELHEQTDFRDIKKLSRAVDYMVADVSFISLRELLPHAAQLARVGGKSTEIIAMVKPQFEAENSAIKHKGVIKNEKMRREILKDFELWCKQYFKIIAKADSHVSGEKGNTERFYKLRVLPK